MEPRIYLQRILIEFQISLINGTELCENDRMLKLMHKVGLNFNHFLAFIMISSINTKKGFYFAVARLFFITITL